MSKMTCYYAFFHIFSLLRYYSVISFAYAMLGELLVILEMRAGT